MTQNPNQNHPDRTPTLTLIPTLKELALLPLNKKSKRMINISRIDYESVYQSKHFLDLVHNICLPLSSSKDKSSDCQNENKRITCFKIPCVIELMDVGVKFDAKEKLSLNMFDICFKHGHFKIPKFKVSDSTETFFCNIITYEQHSSQDKPKYFTDYTSFMDQLINIKEDVSQLRCHEVLKNWLGDDEEVALLFNSLGKGRIVSKQL
ncbi:hypothetical protein CsSME_00024680 [Camellia sinensis var. sinensis]